MADAIDQIREILIGIGLAADTAPGDARLRGDLGLDSTETTQLEIELVERLNVRVDLWDAKDYTILELADMVRR